MLNRLPKQELLPKRELLEAAARQLGLDLWGVVRATDLPAGPDLPFFFSWLERGYHAALSYMTGARAEIRADLERLLPGTRSVICLALNYNTPLPYSTSLPEATRAWISRYAWGEDYHQVFREKLESFVTLLQQRMPCSFQARIAVDTSPVLERALARHTGVGWLGKNTCLINQQLGSWLFLGEVLTTLDLEPDAAAVDRCGTCARCLDACPTGALLEPRVLDSRLCISYWTIEARGSIPVEMRPGLGRHVFGCDICQDVCPWNRKAPATQEQAFLPRPGLFNPPLEELARITEEQFRDLFRDSPIQRVRYRGFLRNVCVAMGNSGDPKFISELKRLAAHPSELIREHAAWALERLRSAVSASDDATEEPGRENEARSVAAVRSRRGPGGEASGRPKANPNGPLHVR